MRQPNDKYVYVKCEPKLRRQMEVARRRTGKSFNAIGSEAFERWLKTPGARRRAA